MLPQFLRNGRVELVLPESTASQSTRCPYCPEVFDPPEPQTPVREIGTDYRDHLATEHPFELHDLQTTRWHEGAFIRGEPWHPKPRPLRSRKEPRGNHGLARLERLGGGEPESDDEWVTVTCRCGWTSLSTLGSRLAWHELRIHYRNDYRLACPHCGWYFEDQDREHAERQMAQHIGTTHPDRFPWGYA